MLAHKFAGVALQHEARCPVCASAPQWCPVLVDALQAVIDWRDGRALSSRAAWLRAGHEIAAVRGLLGLDVVSGEPWPLEREHATAPEIAGRAA